MKTKNKGIKYQHRKDWIGSKSSCVTYSNQPLYASLKSAQIETLSLSIYIYNIRLDLYIHMYPHLSIYIYICEWWMMTCLPLSLPLYKDRTGIGIFKQWMAFICWNPTLKTVRDIQTSQRNLSWHRRNKCPLSVKKKQLLLSS